MSVRVKYMDFFEKHHRLDDFLFAIKFWQFLTWCHHLKGLIKYHPNRLHIKTLQRGWIDCDQQLLHACMQILTNFVEKEKINGMVDWEWDENHLKASKTIDRLYDWWKHDPFAQEATIMPEEFYHRTALESGPLVAIGNWIEDIYYSDTENMKWAKKVIAKCKKNHLVKAQFISELQYNDHMYYHCLNLIEQEAINRQNKALKDLISIRGYLWT